MDNLTSIKRIGVVKHSYDQWSTLSKKFNLEKAPDYADVRLDSTGVCGIFINGAFLEANTGRYVNRIAAFECTSLLKEGENTIELKLGDHYYQPTGNQIFERTGTRFSCVAIELTVKNGTDVTKIITDETWDCDDELSCFSEVTKAEYERFWLHAALWKEQKEISVDPCVLKLQDEEYKKTLLKKSANYINIDNVVEQDEEHIIYDLGKLYVGYLEIEYEAKEEGNIELFFDYTEKLSDFAANAPIIKMLSLTEPLKKGSDKLFLLHRRAFRYLKVQHKKDVNVLNIRLRESKKTYSQSGWFRCEDELLNKIWEVGKYTLDVNRHQEYESCPRNEMKFFSGDAIIEALVDYYTSGDPTLTDASLSLTEIDSNLGIRHNRLQRGISLWDYPAWRILMAYNHYKYFGDRDFVKNYFDELKTCMEWLMDRMNSRYLIYQYPVFAAPMYASLSVTEYNSSSDRLGEKPLLNALLYKCLLCMSELAEIVKDDISAKWRELAEKVKAAINTHLWSEEKKAYMDTFNTEYIPEDGNALCVLFGISDEERSKEALKTIQQENWTPYGASMINSEKMKIRNQLKTISPVMNMYEAEARFLQNDEESALELIRLCWGGMIKKGAETFWEFIPNHPTERWDIPSHGWAAGCTYLLGAYVLGIRPEKAGYEEVLFAPCESLDNYYGVVPTAKGEIAVKKQNKKYTLVIPKSVKVSTEIKELEIIEY